MKKLLLFLVALILAIPAYAGPHTDAFIQCLGNSTTGKDRKDLAKWFVSVMVLHPDIADVAMVTPERRTSINKTVANLYTQLMTDRCGKEMKNAHDKEGQLGLKAGFEYLGRLAVQELMSNPKVATGITEIGKYVDREKIQRAMQP